MPAKRGNDRAARRTERVGRKRVPTQPAGMPQGEHLKGFKGMKTEGNCLCGGCNPAALAGKDKVVIIYA